MVYSRWQVSHLLEGAAQVVMDVLLNELPGPPLVHAQRLPAQHAAVSSNKKQPLYTHHALQTDKEHTHDLK